jgi:hypothetical protein
MTARRNLRRAILESVAIAEKAENKGACAAGSARRLCGKAPSRSRKS